MHFRNTLTWQNDGISGKSQLFIETLSWEADAGEWTNQFLTNQQTYVYFALDSSQAEKASIFQIDVKSYCSFVLINVKNKTQKKHKIISDVVAVD